MTAKIILWVILYALVHGNESRMVQAFEFSAILNGDVERADKGSWDSVSLVMFVWSGLYSLMWSCYIFW